MTFPSSRLPVNSQSWRLVASWRSLRERPPRQKSGGAKREMGRLDDLSEHLGKAEGAAARRVGGGWRDAERVVDTHPEDVRGELGGKALRHLRRCHELRRKRSEEHTSELQSQF